LIGAVAEQIDGVEAVYHAPFSHRFPPAKADGRCRAPAVAGR
jgi:hypothetical protein